LAFTARHLANFCLPVRDQPEKHFTLDNSFAAEVARRCRTLRRCRSVRGFVRCNDAVGDAAAVADLVPASAGPLPDVCPPTTALRWLTSSAPGGGQNAASVRRERTDLLAEFLTVRRAQVNLVRVSVHRK
jgi:hypothetical protein